MPETDSSNVNINLSAFGKVKLGQGVVGRTSWAVVAAVAAMGAIGVAMGNATLQFIVVLIIAAIFGGWLWAILWYANKHPEPALLEGAELLQFRQLEMAAKNQAPTLPEANTSPPQITGEGQ